MKVVNQSYEILDVIPGKELKHIEKIGRVCYKSEDKISEDDSSAKKFVKMLVDHKHLAMTEHAGIAFIMKGRMFSQVKKMAYIFETRTGQACQLRFSETRGALLRYIVSGNMRAWLETLNEYISREEIENGEECCTTLPSNMMQVFSQYPEIFGDVIPVCYEDPDDLVETHRIYPDEMTAMEKSIHQTVSVKFITDRGVSHELVRHRPMSFAQESQRYVSYNKEKFGGEISFIDPFTCVTNDAKMAALDDATLFDMKVLWERACLDAEKTYMSLVEAGATPQIARSVLPNCTKTEITMTGNLAEWEHFFELRCDKAAHPAMRELVIPLKEEFIRRGDISE